MEIGLYTSWLWTYLHSIGRRRVLGASGTVINGVPRVTAGLVARQLEEGPVVLAEVQLVLLLPHEAVLALGDQAAQGLGVQRPQLAVHPLLAVHVAQEVVEAGGRGHLAGHAELRGGEGLEGSAGPASPCALGGAGAPVAVSFGALLQGLGGGEGTRADPQAGWVDEGRLLSEAHIALRMANIQPGVGSTSCFA